MREAVPLNALDADIVKVGGGDLSAKERIAASRSTSSAAAAKKFISSRHEKSFQA